MMNIRLLGQFDVRQDDLPIIIPSRLAQTLLSYLLMNPSVRHRREKLAGLLWPDSEETSARSNLRHSLWLLRNALGEEYLLADRISISINPDAELWVDVPILVDEPVGERNTVDALIASVSVYQGELLPGFYDNWVMLERDRLHSVFERKMQTLLGLLIAQERWSDVMAWGERWIALGGVPEPAYRAMMIACAAMADSAGLVAVYRRCCDALEESLGVPPSEQTREIYEQFLNGNLEVESQVQLGGAASDPGIAIRNLMDRWHERGIETLDPSKLGLLLAAGENLELNHEQARVLVRSMLHLKADLAPWLKHIGSPQIIAGVLGELLELWPDPEGRERIIEALEALEGREAEEILMRLVERDDSEVVRSLAAAAAARRGRLDDVVRQLVVDSDRTNAPSALAALVTIADEIGLPENMGGYPKLRVMMGVARRRWHYYRPDVAQLMVWGGLGAGLGTALAGSGAPLYMALARPAAFRETLELVSIPAWVLSGALAALFVGGLQGLSTSFFVGLADALWGSEIRNGWRRVFGVLSGLAYALYLNGFALTGLLSPEVEPGTYLPVNLLYGLLLGMLVSFLVPRLGAYSSFRRQLARSLLIGFVICLMSVPYAYVIYHEMTFVSLLPRLAPGLMLPLGFGLGLSGHKSQVSFPSERVVPQSSVLTL